MNFADPVVGHVCVLLLALLVILGASELFTNGIEWLGQHLGLSEGVVGSVLAAVGTALPETLIPVVAVVMFGTRQAQNVGIGAIAGAPFMLSTLTLSLCGAAVFLFTRIGRRAGVFNLNKVVLTRDLRFFILAYTAALAAGLLRNIAMARLVIAILLVFSYGLYLYKTFTHEGEMGEAPEHLHFDRLLKAGTGFSAVVLQVLSGLAGILGGAFLFVDHVQSLSRAVHVPELILSLLIAPIATELPEKVNSVLWVRNGKDTLALGNVTGALVFQSCFPVAFGVAFTSWNLGAGVLTTGLVALASATFYLLLLERDKLRPQHLLAGVVCYISTLTWLLLTRQID